MASLDFVLHIICLLAAVSRCHSLLLPNTSAQHDSWVPLGTAQSFRNLSASDALSYQEAVRKGTQLYTQLKNHEFKEKDIPITVQQLRASGWSIPRWPANVQSRSQCLPHLSKQGIDFIHASSAEDYYTIAAESPGFVSLYEESYSPKNRLIVAADIFRDSTIPGPHWSDVTYAVWFDTCVNTKASIGDLQYIIQYRISNDKGTGRILAEISSRHPSKSTWTVFPTGETADQFRAILGTPNGSGTVYLLGEHRASLGDKTLTSITYDKSESGRSNLILELMPEHDKPDKSSHRV